MFEKDLMSSCLSGEMTKTAFKGKKRCSFLKKWYKIGAILCNFWSGLSNLYIGFLRMAPHCFYWSWGFLEGGGGCFCSGAEIGYASPAVRVTTLGFSVKDLYLGL